ncbi:DNA polymerase Y family protein [Leucobacter aridicollis]|uniref:DNA polymerase Y family protein n=1 Tax=Leucobacter aridicollis TaxID=283878 RepID=UPI0021032AC9|nr:DNA polymerase Y family protein [Leucobacter aridicollis]UTX52114.1 DNA polymerase Y family protein [Leucobacter aridicollis]
MPPERVITLHFVEWPREDTKSGRSSAAAETTEAPPDFAPVFAKLTELVPAIEELRPGLVAMRARGPVRYYGGERAVANALLEFARAEGLGRARVGIADGRFAAELAASADPDPADCIRIVEPGGAAAFLSDLPVGCATDEKLGQLLPGLGIYTLGAFAALPEDAVRARFGPGGVLAHRHARGEDGERGEPVRAQQAARDFALSLDFEPPIAGTEQLTFACSSLVERFIGALTEERLVCTSLRVTLTDDIGIRHERDWAHPRFFSPQDALARLRWQSESLVAGFSGSDERGAGAGIATVRIAPVRTDRIASHEPGLWTSGPDERVHHHLSRAQGLLGPGGVGTVSLDGGRLLLERQQFTHWGSAPKRDRAPGPWPGALSAPHPTLVFSPPLRARLLDEAGTVVGVDAEDLLAATPYALRVEGHRSPGAVRGWSKPWPIREHWWDGRPERFRLQLELDTGDSWLLLARVRPGESDGETTTWFAEGKYD